MQYWLIKSEPNVYSWEQLKHDDWACWDGIRNYQARNNLQTMKVGDKAMFYHSNLSKHIVGIAKVVREAYPDPSSDNKAWVAVDVQPDRALATPVTLAAIKAEPALATMGLLRQSQLSVTSLTKQEYAILCRMGGIKA